MPDAPTKCPVCGHRFDPTASERWIGTRIVHLYSGFYGTVIREYDKAENHAVVEWDQAPGRRLPYRLDVTRPMYVLVRS